MYELRNLSGMKWLASLLPCLLLCVWVLISSVAAQGEDPIPAIAQVETGQASSTENEMHCIEPAMTTTPISFDADGDAIKPSASSSYLTRQVFGFTQRWANVSQTSGYLIDFPVTDTEVSAVGARITKRSALISRYPGIKFGTYGPPQ